MWIYLWPLFCSVDSYVCFCTSSTLFWRASLVAKTVKNLPAIQETQVWSLGLDDPIEKRTAGYSFAPFWCLCQKLSLSPLYFNKTLLHKSSERSSLISGPGLNSSPPEAKNPASHRSATNFHLGGSSRILQDKMGLIIYVSLLLLTPEILSLPFDPQDNAFLSWAHSYAAFHNLV